MKHVPAYRGEFGLKIYRHVPQVHTLGLRGDCHVEVEEGEEALYPSVFYSVVPRAEDGRRHGPPPDLGVPMTRFVPEPLRRVGIYPNVVVCPRKREYGSGKNWDGWVDFVDVLSKRYEVFAAGAPDSSYSVPCERAWWYPRFLDASIEAMRHARLVIATDAGLAHLAVLCGAPLLIVTYRGLVAPGPVIDSGGRKARDSYWRAGFDPAERVNRFENANHTGAPIGYVDGWEDPAKVVEVATSVLEAFSHQEERCTS